MCTCAQLIILLQMRQNILYYSRLPIKDARLPFRFININIQTVFDINTRHITVYHIL